MSSRYLSRHVEFDDPRHYSFMRDSKIPHGTFDGTPAWMTTKRWRWGVIAVLILAFIGAVVVHGDRPDQTMHATARTAR